MIEDEELAKFHRMFFDADEASDDERLEAKRARDYFDGKQYTAEELEILQKRRQPPTTLNRVARKVNHLLGLEIDRRTDPKAYPRTPEHDEAAEAATDALRFVEQKTSMDKHLSRVHENMLIEGYGAFELGIAQRDDEFEITVDYWEWDRLFYDPHSVKLDFSDAMYIGGVVWLDIKQAEKHWPGKKGLLQAGAHSPASGSTVDNYEDEPERKAWVTRGSRPRVRIVHMYYKVGDTWHLVQFTGGGILFNQEVPFRDDNGDPFCPLMIQGAYVDRDGDRYGEVRNLISPQDMINKTHSKIQHLVSVRQIVADEGAISEDNGGIDEARQQLARPDGVIIKNPDLDFEILSTADQVGGQAALLQEFKAEMDLMGPNASMQGKGPQSQSGRALIAQTEGGMREFNPVADRFNDLKERGYRAIWGLIRQYWDTPRWIRVTDDERKVRHVGLNMPITRMQLAEERLKERGANPQQVEAVMQQIQTNPELATLSQQVGEVRNEVAKIDVDIIIETTPDMVTLQAEQFQQLATMAPALAQAGQAIPPKVLIKASSLRNKDELLEEMDGKGEEPTPEQAQQLQQAEQLKQMQIQLELAKMEAEVEKIRSEAAKNRAMAENQGGDPQDDTAELTIEEVKLDQQAQLEREKIESQERTKQLDRKAQAEMKQLEIAAQAEMKAIEIQAKNASTEGESSPENNNQAVDQLVAIADEMKRAATAPKRIIRDENGFISGVETIQ